MVDAGFLETDSYPPLRGFYLLVCSLGASPRERARKRERNRTRNKKANVFVDVHVYEHEHVHVGRLLISPLVESLTSPS